MSLGEVCVLLLEVQAGLGVSTPTLESLQVETGTGLALGLEEALEVGSQRDRGRARWLEAPEGLVESCRGAREAEEEGTQRQGQLAGKTLGGKWEKSCLDQGRGPARWLQS